MAGAAALLGLGVEHRAVKLDGGGRRAEVLDRQFGGGGWVVQELSSFFVLLSTVL